MVKGRSPVFLHFFPKHFSTLENVDYESIFVYIERVGNANAERDGVPHLQCPGVKQ